MSRLASFSFIITFFITIASSYIYGSPAIELQFNNIDGTQIGKNIEYLEDEKGNLTINDMKKPVVFTQFIQYDKDNISLGFKTNPHWFRFSINNNTNKIQEIYFEIGYSMLDSVELYSPQMDTSFIKTHLGDKKPYKERLIDHHNFVFPTKIFPGENTYYMRVQTTSSLNVPIKIWSKTNFTYKANKGLMFLGIFYGICLVMFFYNLFIYFSSFDKNYLIYVIFMALTAGTTLPINGIGFRYIWPETLFLNDSAAFMLAICDIFAFLFAMIYLNTKKHTPIIHKTMIFFIIIYSIIMILSLILPYEKIIKIATAFQALGALYLIFVGVVFAFKRSRAALFFLPAWIVMMIGVGLETIKNLALLPSNDFTNSGLMLGISLQLVIFSIGLADKLNTLKNKLQDLNQNLENKVEERTEELQAAMEEMEGMNSQLIETRDALWGEMELAKKIQTVLLPKILKAPGYEITGYMNAADEVGGDYYDVIHLRGIHWFIIGDVSGHGVSAGLVMMMVQTSIHVALDHNPNASPADLLTKINHTISHNIQQLNDDKYMTITVFAALDNGKFTFSGLHQDILIYRAATKKVEQIETNGMWIGLFDDLTGMVSDENFLLEKNDTMLLYTDGITEAWLKGSVENERKVEKDMFGEERLISIFNEEGNTSPESIRDAIVGELANYDCKDDVTMLIVKKL